LFSGKLCARLSRGGSSLEPYRALVLSGFDELYQSRPFQVYGSDRSDGRSLRIETDTGKQESTTSQHPSDEIVLQDCSVCILDNWASWQLPSYAANHRSDSLLDTAYAHRDMRRVGPIWFTLFSRLHYEAQGSLLFNAENMNRNTVELDSPNVLGHPFGIPGNSAQIELTMNRKV